tara:strand:+ start:2923 stop:3084 length:162 start_codon:yes stop_codon:yes gene_type:complete
MTLTDYIQIEEILAEANAYGIKLEVIDLANKIEMLHDLSKLDAHQRAFNTLIG